MYDITTFGIDKRYFMTVSNSIATSIKMAHDNLSAGGKLKVNQGLLFNSNIKYVINGTKKNLINFPASRSPNAYLANPEKERQEYATEGDTDKVMTVLRLEDDRGKELGAIAWYVNCTPCVYANLQLSIQVLCSLYQYEQH